MKRLHLFGFLAVFFALAYFATPALAAGPPVVINELMFNPAGSEPAGEWVELYVNSAPGDMNGWTVRDAGGTTYIFPALTPAAGEYIVLHTGSGTDDLTPPVYHLYWGRGSGIWNNTGDEILLTDGTADVDYIAYGSATPTISGTLIWSGTNPTAPEGISISLKNNGVDTDTGDDWEASGTSVTRAPSSAGETNAAPVAVWVDDDFCAACANGGHTWGYDAFSAIQPGLSALAVDGTAWVADGIYTETLRVTKNVSLIGASETGVTVDASTAPSGYGLEATGDISTTWRNFTLIGPPAAATGYGIKVAGENAQTVLENITVKNSGRSGVDLNGLAAASLKNITALNNGGVGIGLTDSSNVSLAGITTAGNTWGGIGIYTYGRYYSGGSDGIALTGTNSFGEQNPLYLETENYSDPANPYPVTNFSQADFGFSVRNNFLPADTFYQPTQTEAITTALTLPLPGAEQPHESTITELATGNWLVADGMSIQTAVDAATAGDTIRVLDGVFTEQLMVSKNLLLTGNGTANTVIQSPATLSPCFTTSYTAYPIVCITGADNVQLDGFMVDGAGQGNANYKFMGIAFRNAGGTVQNSDIRRIENTPFNGAQHGVGLYAFNDDGISRALTVDGNAFSDFQKNAMALSAGVTTTLTISVTGNTVTGKGTTPVTAQNGIQTWGASISGVISGNVVSGIGYDGASWVASSILNIDSPVLIENNVVTQAQVGIYNWDGSAEIASNTVAVQKSGDYAFGIVATDPPDALPSPFDTVLSPPPAPKWRTLAATAALTPAITVTIRSNTISANGVDTYTFGIEADAGYGADYLNLTVDGNTITGFDEGLVLYQTTAHALPGFATVSVSKNTLSNNVTGIDSYANTGDTTISGNTLTGNTDGLFITGTTALTLTDNIVYANTNNGMTIADDLSAAGVTAVNNQFCDNGGLGIENLFITTTLTATGNWWGAVDGPGPIAAGLGDGVSAGVDTSGFTTVPPASGPCQTADITVRAVTDPATGATGFPFSGDLGAFSLDDGGSQFFQLTPGSYTVTETVPSGWELTGVTCTADSTPLTAGVSIPVARGDDVTCTFTNDPLPNILASKMLSVETLPEPGGTLTATVTITNTTAETVTLTALADSQFGDVAGHGTCATGGNLAPFGVYSCSFADSVSGNAGDVFSGTLTAIVQDGEGNTASAADSASVTLTDVLPTISVTKSVTPTVLPVGGGVVTVTVTVQNTSVEPVYLVSLYDDNLYRALDGNLSGIGSCAVGMWIATANNYGCTFTQTVGGAAGDVRNDKITASAIDDENNIVTADSIAGLIINTPPAFTSSPPLTATVGAAYTYTVTVSDANAGDPLTITAPTLPAWLTFTDNGDGTATLFGTPAAGDAGESPVVLSVSDGMATVTQPFSIIVSEPPAAPPNIRIYLPLVVR